MSDHILVTLGKEYFSQSKENKMFFVYDEEANALLNDIDHYPHAFVLACCMDRQAKAERVWMIPYLVMKEIGSFDIHDLAQISKGEYSRIFKEQSLHRFNDSMAGIFYNAVQLIIDKYDGDASKIWKGKPSSSAVVSRFLEFKGVGIKIATMATNILARDFKILFSDYYSIDVSPDVHVRRVLSRIGLIGENATTDQIIYRARELNPEFPGIIDHTVWEIGRTWCDSQNPLCDKCPVNMECKYCLERQQNE